MSESVLGLESLFKPELILCNLPALDKARVLQELINAVCRSIPGLDAKELLYAVAQRDRMAPTPLGKGLAFCHARTEKVPELTIALAICPEGSTGFTPPDGSPVILILLFLVPKQHSDLYLKAMSALLRELSQPQARQAVSMARQPIEVIQLISKEPTYPDIDAVSALFTAMREGKVEPVAEVLARTPPAYLAELVEDLVPEDRARFLSKLEVNRAASIMENMHLIPAAAALRRISPDIAAKILGYVNIAHTADVLRHLKPEEQSAILKHLGIRKEKGVEAVLKYPPSTAGGIMTPEAMVAQEGATVSEALKTVATFTDPRQTDLYIVSTDGRLQGKCAVRALLAADPAAKVSDLMQRNPEIVQPEQDQEEIRRLVARESLHSIPVVGLHGTLVGVITQDDILDVIEQEASEDILRAAGSEIMDPLHTPLSTRIIMRLPWLLLTLGGELFIALVISKIFQPTLEKAVVLAAFIPAIMATGGNVGLQSTTMVIRSLGMGTLKPRHTAQLILGEVKLGILTGLSCGLIAAFAAYLINWNYHEVLKVSMSVFLAMLSATLATSLVGTLEPLVLHKFKFDPATACGPFVTMFNDIFGSVVYLLIAMLMHFSSP